MTYQRVIIGQLERGVKVELMEATINGNKGLGFVWEHYQGVGDPFEWPISLKLLNPPGKLVRAQRYEVRRKRDQSGIRPPWVFEDELPAR